MIRSAAWSDRDVDMVAPFPFRSMGHRRTIPLLSTSLKPQSDDYRSGADVLWGLREENQNDTLGNTHIEALLNRDVPFTTVLQRVIDLSQSHGLSAATSESSAACALHLLAAARSNPRL